MPAISILTLFALLLAAPASGQTRTPSHCIAIADALPEGPETIWRAGWGDPLAADTVRLSYVGHSTYFLETPSGLSVATDFTGILGTADVVPDVVTMNRAHSSHWTAEPDPRIPHVLPGWDWSGEPADHHLDLGEMLVRNVPTDIRGGVEGVIPDGNSIFVFEVAGLCIGHLGHLHHEPTPEQYAALGRLDVVMVPVDGGMTLDLPTMIGVMKRLRASVVLPMHWFGDGTLGAFLAGMEGDFAIERRDQPFVELSLAALPARPTVIVLPPRPLQ
ncbi:MBL fold metallo-hydrolase [Albidovulum sediminis]|uniref:MBL fold metallo-hydrolase n=1 Tax=Albidovulum sediminis TaxID=3066345 RepID=A0ABT2NLP5_9RHOB|nr:MBL fold metallo-hydrolase [Defluviimonas sediminis]MCT8329852.1 MBL fold metallo-hydrolase [Defluviimonas sediminis]